METTRIARHVRHRMNLSEHVDVHRRAFWKLKRGAAVEEDLRLPGNRHRS